MSDKAVRGTALVVDDDPDFRTQMACLLQGQGFETLEASGRAEAEALLDKGLPDLAVVDLMMDEMDAGFVLSHRLKRRAPDLPVIIVTGVTTATGIDFGTGAQGWIRADAMLSKPVRAAQLAEVVDRLMARGDHGDASGTGD